MMDRVIMTVDELLRWDDDDRLPRGGVLDEIMADRCRTGCLLCGETDPACLSFYLSLRPRTSPVNLWMVTEMTTPDELRSGLADLLLLCANCHAKIGAERHCSTCRKPFKPEDEVIQYFMVGAEGVPWTIDGFYHHNASCDRWWGNADCQTAYAPPGHRRTCFTTKP